MYCTLGVERRHEVGSALKPFTVGPHTDRGWLRYTDAATLHHPKNLFPIEKLDDRDERRE